MKYLHFAAFSGFSFPSKLIKFWTRSKYSHIAYLNVYERPMYLIEAWNIKRNSLKLEWQKIESNNFYELFKNHSPGTPIDIFKIPVSDSDFEKVDKLLQLFTTRKTKYDWIGIIGFVLKIKNRTNIKKMFCSEGCIYPLKIINNWEIINPFEVSPRDFVYIIEPLSKFKFSFILGKENK